MSVIRISKMHVWPRSQNPWQLASPLSSVVVGGCGVPAVGVDDDGGVVLLAAVPAQQLMLENILGLRLTRHGENAVVHSYLHSSATSLCRMCTKPLILHDRACSTVILALIQFWNKGNFGTAITNNFIEHDVGLDEISRNGYKSMGFDRPKTRNKIYSPSQPRSHVAKWLSYALSI